MAAAVGGGLYEHVVLTRIWSASPPSSFAIIRPDTGVPLQRFWVPVHAAITIFVLASVILTWGDARVRTLMLVGLGSYIVMRAWSFAYFIPEMLAFQQIATDSAPTAEPPDPGLQARLRHHAGELREDRSTSRRSRYRHDRGRSPIGRADRPAVETLREPQRSTRAMRIRRFWRPLLSTSVIRMGADCPVTPDDPYCMCRRFGPASRRVRSWRPDLGAEVLLDGLARRQGRRVE